MVAPFVGVCRPCGTCASNREARTTCGQWRYRVILDWADRTTEPINIRTWDQGPLGLTPPSRTLLCVSSVCSAEAVRDESRLELYWIPLGAGDRVVRASGRAYERLYAFVHRRRPYELYHSALVATTPSGAVVIEMAPIRDNRGRQARGVVNEGSVGARWAGRFRIFRYEIRRWRNGVIPDLPFAVSSPVLVADDALIVQRVLDLVPRVPTPVWGRDELQAGEMWNSNSVISWLLTWAGVCTRAGPPPANGRAPGWDAGIQAAQRSSVRLWAATIAAN